MFENTNSFFWICALAGSGLFIIQFFFSLLGFGDDDSSMDDGKIQWLSKQAVTGFLMMFGWTALTCKQEFDLSHSVSIAIGSAIGLATVFISGYIFKSAKKLHSSGTAFKIDDIVGKEATVYQRIPKGGIGKISISLHNLTHEIDAVAEQDLESFIPVQIIKKRDDNTVVVVAINR
jgi:hypothetical protein